MQQPVLYDKKEADEYLPSDIEFREYNAFTVS
jgi:hypothetical protein